MAPSEFAQGQRITYLISRYVAGDIDFAELQELDRWRKEKDSNELLFQELTDEGKQQAAIKKMHGYDSKTSLEKLKQTIRSNSDETKISYFTFGKLLIAATTVLALSILFFYYRQGSSNTATDLKPRPIYVAAGSDKATLTLANGKKILIGNTSGGIIAMQAGIRIQNSKDGKITYTPTLSHDNNITAYNTIETPRAGKYQVQLPDGTHVWLNAASSLHYPVSFNGKTREVTLTGEGYFEVAKDKTKPFTVISSGQRVTVLGTHFNINAYKDEAHISTTLLEGSVQVDYGGNHTLLKPGEQSALKDGKLKVSKADTHLPTAWKDGQLAFLHTDLQAVLRQISRWYNIDIEYVGKAPEFSISGDVSRDADLSAILAILKVYDVHFVQQDHKLIIIN